MSETIEKRNDRLIRFLNVEKDIKSLFSAFIHYKINPKEVSPISILLNDCLHAIERQILFYDLSLNAEVGELWQQLQDFRYNKEYNKDLIKED